MLFFPFFPAVGVTRVRRSGQTCAEVAYLSPGGDCFDPFWNGNPFLAFSLGLLCQDSLWTV